MSLLGPARHHAWDNSDPCITYKAVSDENCPDNRKTHPILKHSIGLPAIPCTMSEPTLGFFVPLPAQDGKSTDLKNFLLKGRELIDNEPLTLQWYAVEYTGDAYASTPTFAIFDTFAATEGLTAHKEGEFTNLYLGVLLESVI